MDKIADPKVFTAKAVKNIISYKWSLLKAYGYMYCLYYGIYMLCIIVGRQGGWVMIGVWFILHSTEEVIQMCLSNEGLITHFSEIWNVFDIARVVAMLAFIVIDIKYNSVL